MTATTTRTTVTVKKGDLEALFARLPKNIVEALEKRAFRAGLKPVQEKLRTAWLATPGRKGKKRKAIALSTIVDVRRGMGGLVTGKVGVDYKFKASGKAHQRIWHLLEAGFRHYGSSPLYMGAGDASKAASKARKVFVRDHLDRINADKSTTRKEKRKQIRNVQKAANATITAAARNERSVFGEAKRVATARRIPGRWISKRIVDAELQNATDRCAALMLEEARKELAK